MDYDLIIVGSGPAGIFTALELIKRNSKRKYCLLKKASLLKKDIVPKVKPVIVSTANQAVPLPQDFQVRVHSPTASSASAMRSAEICLHL